jgi:hypothetical protein
MKKLGLIAIVFVLVVACSQEPKTPHHHGAWKMVQTQRIQGDSVQIRYPVTWQGEQIKMWSENYWMLVGKATSTTPETDIYGGGTYKLEGKEYTEYIEYLTSNQYVGKVNDGLTLYVKDDTLFQTYHPVDTLGNLRKDITYLEKYVRH